MATVTFTTPLGPQQPKYGPNRSWSNEQTIVSSATFSAGDVYIFNNLKIPDRAVVTDVQIQSSVVDGTYLIEVGTYGSKGTADVFGSITMSATAVMNSVRTVGLPYTVSVSDDATFRYQTMGVRVDGAATSGTPSVSINLRIKYFTR
jgi:Tfp pilus assembly protein PilW